MLTNREKYLVKEAYLEGFEEGWSAAIETVVLRQSFFTDSRVHASCKNWLNEEAADGGITVEMIVSKEAGESDEKN